MPQSWQCEIEVYKATYHFIYAQKNFFSGEWIKHKTKKKSYSICLCSVRITHIFLHVLNVRLLSFLSIWQLCSDTVWLGPNVFFWPVPLDRTGITGSGLQAFLSLSQSREGLRSGLLDANFVSNIEVNYVGAHCPCGRPPGWLSSTSFSSWRQSLMQQSSPTTWCCHHHALQLGCCSDIPQNGDLLNYSPAFLWAEWPFSSSFYLSSFSRRLHKVFFCGSGVDLHIFKPPPSWADERGTFRHLETEPKDEPDSMAQLISLDFF